MVQAPNEGYHAISCKHVRSQNIRETYGQHDNAPTHLIPFPSFSLPAVLCDPTNLIWR